jgi:hypothetical protein
MTELLEKALAEAAKLSAVEQNIFANWILEELASEQRWQTDFANSEDALAFLAKEAREAYHLDETEPLNPAEL